MPDMPALDAYRPDVVAAYIKARRLVPTDEGMRLMAAAEELSGPWLTAREADAIGAAERAEMNHV